MKKVLFGAVACLGAYIGFATTPASAQSMEMIRVNLPVAAKVGNVSLPAGEYSIHELNNSVIEISSFDHKGMNTFATVNTVVGAAADHTKVILKKDDNGYQIQTIWIEGQELGFELNSASN